MKTVIADMVSLMVIVLTVIVTLALYPDLPDPMPTHWNAAGQVDAYMSRPWGVAILPAAATFVFLVMKGIVLISPKVHKTEELSRITGLFQVLLVGFMCAIAVLVLLESLGHHTRLNQVILGGIGLLLLVMGKNLDKLRKNFFIGIRTPWTLRNEEVWDRTHRFGGKLFMLAGLMLFVNAFITIDFRWSLLAVVALLLVPVFYSYILYRQVNDRVERHPAD